MDHEKTGKSINHNPTVALLGVRQVGKTTLANSIAENTMKGMLWQKQTK